MKILFLALCMPVTAQSQLLAQSLEPVEITTPVDRIFIPDGYNDNDNVEVVVQGNFPDTCYQVGKINAQIDAASKTVTVSATSLRCPGKFCLQTITAFIQSVKLGAVAQGEYSFQGEGLLHVRTLNGTSFNRFINIQ